MLRSPWLPLNNSFKLRGPGLEAGNYRIMRWEEVDTDKKQNKAKNKENVEIKPFIMNNKLANKDHKRSKEK